NKSKEKHMFYSIRRSGFAVPFRSCAMVEPRGSRNLSLSSPAKRLLGSGLTSSASHQKNGHGLTSVCCPPPRRADSTCHCAPAGWTNRAVRETSPYAPHQRGRTKAAFLLGRMVGGDGLEPPTYSV